MWEGKGFDTVDLKVGQLMWHPSCVSYGAATATPGPAMPPCTSHRCVEMRSGYHTTPRCARGRAGRQPLPTVGALLGMCRYRAVLRMQALGVALPLLTSTSGHPGVAWAGGRWCGRRRRAWVWPWPSAPVEATSWWPTTTPPATAAPTRRTCHGLPTERTGGSEGRREHAFAFITLPFKASVPKEL